jgi:hypothetical protein
MYVRVPAAAARHVRAPLLKVAPVGNNLNVVVCISALGFKFINRDTAIPKSTAKIQQSEAFS